MRFSGCLHNHDAIWKAMVFSPLPPLGTSIKHRRARGEKWTLVHIDGRRVARRPLKSIAQMSDAEWARAFPNEEACIEWLVTCRWPQEVCCPRCGSSMVFPTSLKEYRWRCFGCVPDLGYHFVFSHRHDFSGR